MIDLSDFNLNKACRSLQYKLSLTCLFVSSELLFPNEDKTLLGADIDVFCRRLRINYIFNGNEEDEDDEIYYFRVNISSFI
jgi:hypothetical protein